MNSFGWLLRKALWINLAKVALLAFIATMILVQIPELRYDFGPKEPLRIDSPDALAALAPQQAVFAAVSGRPSFDKAFKYRRYGITYTYFNLEPYGLKIVVRTHQQVTDDWRSLSTFLGKLKPFDRQPFSYKLRAIYAERLGVTIPEPAYFLALDDVPKANAWQLGAVAFAGVLWVGCGYAFYLHGWLRARRRCRI